MKLSKTVLLLTSLLISNLAYTQTLNQFRWFGNKGLDIIISPGFIIQNEPYGDLSITLGRAATASTYSDFIALEIEKGSRGLRIGLESNFKTGDDFTIAPKIGVETTLFNISARLSVLNYFQNGNSQFRLLPEIGLYFKRFIYLTYGYGIKFNNANIKNVSSHRFGISFALHRNYFH